MNDLESVKKAYREQYGRIIRQKRKMKGINQKELAEKLNVTDATISRYEKGTLDIPASTLPIICDICDFDFSEYMEDFTLIHISESLDEISKYQSGSRKAAYPPMEWTQKDCIRERKKELARLESILEQTDSHELLCLADMFNTLQKQKNNMSKEIKEIECSIAKLAKEKIQEIPELKELTFRITALTLTINQK